MFGLTLVAAGIASWFTPYQAEYDGMRVCAMLDRTLVGAHVRIDDLDNRRTSTCVVIGTGPFVAGRVIDVSPIVADDLEMRSAGLAHVRVYLIRCRPTPTPQTCSGQAKACRLSLPPSPACS